MKYYLQLFQYQIVFNMILIWWYETLWGQNMSNTSFSQPKPLLVQKSNNQSFKIYQNSKSYEATIYEIFTGWKSNSREKCISIKLWAVLNIFEKWRRVSSPLEKWHFPGVILAVGSQMDESLSRAHIWNWESAATPFPFYCKPPPPGSDRSWISGRFEQKRR